jgi:hypothetical protein
MEEIYVPKTKEEQIIARLDAIEREVKQTQQSINKMKKFMFWRLIVLIIAILVPAVALPFFINIFLKSYLAGIQSLL